MHNAIAFMSSAIQITLLDIVLSGDNVGVIALAVRRLDPTEARRASAVGITGAIALRILFASLVSWIMTISWLPIKLVGGLLLLKVTWDLVRETPAEDGSQVKAQAGFWRAVTSIIAADISMSLDNVLAIGGMAHGSVGLIAFGIALNVPILFFGSQFVASLMQKYPITIYIGGALLVHTALLLILEDGLIAHLVSHVFTVAFPWVIAAATLVYGWFRVRAGGSPREFSA